MARGARSCSCREREGDRRGAGDAGAVRRPGRGEAERADHLVELPGVVAVVDRGVRPGSARPGRPPAPRTSRRATRPRSSLGGVSKGKARSRSSGGRMVPPSPPAPAPVPSPLRCRCPTPGPPPPARHRPPVRSGPAGRRRSRAGCHAPAADGCVSGGTGVGGGAWRRREDRLGLGRGWRPATGGVTVHHRRRRRSGDRRQGNIRHPGTPATAAAAACSSAGIAGSERAAPEPLAAQDHQRRRAGAWSTQRQQQPP